MNRKANVLAKLAGVCAGLVALHLFVPPILSYGQELQRIDLPTTTTGLHFLPGSNRILATSADDPTITFIDADSAEVTSVVDLGHAVFASEKGPNDRFLYLLGRPPESTDNRILSLSQIDLQTEVVRRVSFEMSVRAPSLAVDTEEQVYIADSGASLIKMIFFEFDFLELRSIPASVFEKITPGETQTIQPNSVPVENLALRRGAARLLFSSDGETLFASHRFLPAVTAFNSRSFEVFDTLYLISSSERKSKETNDISITDFELSAPIEFAPGLSASRTKSDSATLLVGDGENNRLLILEYDPKFRNFNVLQTAHLGTPQSGIDTKQGTESQILITSATDSQLLAVGSPQSQRITLFRWEDKVLEHVGKVQLDANPEVLAMAPNGHRLAAVVEKGASIAIISGLSSSLETVTERVGDARDKASAQRLLAQLGYPTGAVDGIIGARTELAIGLFQGEFGLERTRQLDKKTMYTLRYIADFKTAFEEAGISEHIYSQLVPRPSLTKPECTSFFELPDRRLWSNAVALAQLLEDFRKRWEGDLQIFNAYISEAEFECGFSSIGDSLIFSHFDFSAVDFRSRLGAPADWEAVFEELTDEGLFQGEIKGSEFSLHVQLRPRVERRN